MSVIFVLIAFSLLVAIGFLILFLWAVRSGQYDDDYTPSVRILFEDETPSDTEENNGDAVAENTNNNSTTKT